MPVSMSLGQQVSANVRKLAGNTALKAPANTPLGLVDKIREPPLLQPPEEEDDNWDDDFEDGISFTKLQGKLEHSSSSKVFPQRRPAL